MKDALVTMLELQDEMNKKVHPDWRSQGNAWYRAIWVECAELLDHYGWKWWKAQSPDRDQVELELIDIWHFGMSIALEMHNTMPSDYASLAENLASHFSDAVEIENGSEAFRSAIEKFAESTLVTRNFDVKGFATLMQYTELSFDRLFRSYVAKNVLNIFRQDHGYKDGTYRKLWAGREDNEHLMAIVHGLDQSEITRDRIYRELSERYQAAS